MRFIIINKCTAETEAGVAPSQELIDGMGALMQDMADAGVLLSGEGLHPTSKATRLTATGGEITRTEGPFEDTQGLSAGFVLVDVEAREDAVRWATRSANLLGDVEIEIRQVVTADDFGDEFTPEAREAEDRLREKIGQK